MEPRDIEREARNKAVVLEAFDALFNRRDFDAAERYWSPDYAQHSAGIGPGRDGLFALVRSVRRRYESSRAVAEGDCVMVHGRFSGGGRPTKIVADIVRIEAGRLVEHWDVVQTEATRTESMSGLPMFGDGFPDVRSQTLDDDDQRRTSIGQYVRATDHALAQNWSNAATTLGGDPCVPAPAGVPYFNVTTPMPSVHGAAGSTIDVPLTGWTTGPMPAFLIYAYTAAGFNAAPALDATHINNGVTTTMHVTIPAGTRSGSNSWVLVLSGPNDGDARNYPVMITAD